MDLSVWWYESQYSMMTSSNGNIKAPRYWPFVRGIHRSPVNSLHKCQWPGALMLPLTCAWINSWVNNGKAGDLRRHCAHYDVIVMHAINVQGYFDNVGFYIIWIFFIFMFIIDLFNIKWTHNMIIQQRFNVHMLILAGGFNQGYLILSSRLFWVVCETIIEIDEEEESIFICPRWVKWPYLWWAHL